MLHQHSSRSPQVTTGFHHHCRHFRQVIHQAPASRAARRNCYFFSSKGGEQLQRKNKKQFIVSTFNENFDSLFFFGFQQKLVNTQKKNDEAAGCRILMGRRPRRSRRSEHQRGGATQRSTAAPPYTILRIIINISQIIK
jgi:hypothetical protein